MQIDSELISYLEDLSCLALSDEEKTSLTGDLQKLQLCWDYRIYCYHKNTTNFTQRSYKKHRKLLYWFKL